MMQQTRREFIEEKMEEFLNSSKTEIFIPLYGSEIKKFPKKFPEVTLEKGKVFSKNIESQKDARIICKISKFV